MVSNTRYGQRKNVEQFLFMCMAHLSLTAVRGCDAYNGGLLEIFLLAKQRFKHQLVVLEELFRMISNLAQKTELMVRYDWHRYFGVPLVPQYG